MYEAVRQREWTQRGSWDAQRATSWSEPSAAPKRVRYELREREMLGSLVVKLVFSVVEVWERTWAPRGRAGQWA